MKNTSYRVQVLKTAKERYQTEPERLWAKYPGYEALWHAENKKWYAMIMDIPRNKLGLNSEEYVDVMNVKADL